MKRRFWGLIRLILVIAILAGVVSMSLAFAKDPRFRFVKIKVLQNELVPTEQIQKACFPVVRQNILTLSLTGHLRAHLLDLFPEFEEVSVGFELPGILVVSVVEKKSVMQFLVGNQVIESASDGTLLKKSVLLPPSVLVSGNAMPTPNQPNVPKVEGIHPRYFATKHLDPTLVKKVRHVLAQVQKSMPLETFVLSFKHLYLTPSLKEDELVLIKNRSIPIKMGSLLTLEAKCNLLAVFFQDSVSKTSGTMKYMDLRIPDKLIVSYGP